MRLSWKFLREVGEREIIPKGYGLAWENWSMGKIKVLPIPFNLIARFGRLVYYWFIFACYPLLYERKTGHLLDAEFKKGWEIGFREGQRERKYKDSR